MIFTEKRIKNSREKASSILQSLQRERERDRQKQRQRKKERDR